MTTIDTASIDWQPYVPALGNYESLSASIDLEHACELLDCAEPTVKKWCRLGNYLITFLVEGSGGYGDTDDRVWLVTMDYDADLSSDGERMVDKSKATSVEVRRA